MDIRQLKHDPEKVLDCIREMEDGSVVVKQPLRIYIPKRFSERNLASIGIDTYIVGICATVTEDNFYSVSMINAMWRIEPSSTTTVLIEDDEYYEFTFDKGSRLLSTTELVKTDTLVYRIYDEIVSKARVPWYISYMNLGKLFETADYHAGVSVGKNREIIEMIVSIISRDQLDRHIQYRMTVDTIMDLKKKPPAFIPMRSVTYAASNTLNKLGGSRFQDGLTSALVSPTDRIEKLEAILSA